MVDVAGHLGFALLAAAPIWFVADRQKAALTFLAIAVPFGLLPDIDLWLNKLFPNAVHHHGITHTIVFVVVVALIAGPIVGWVVRSYLTDHSEIADGNFGRVAVFATVAVLVGGLSHLFGDMLSAPDIAQPIEPFWPILHQPVSIDLLWYNAFWANFGVLAAALLVNLGLWALNRDDTAGGRTAGA